jgi:hypothetical protein
MRESFDSVHDVNRCESDFRPEFLSLIVRFTAIGVGALARAHTQRLGDVSMHFQHGAAQRLPPGSWNH